MKILIVNATNYSLNSWFTTPVDLRTSINILKNAGFEVETIKVADVIHLKRKLDTLVAGTIIWPNTYFINDESNQKICLYEILERLDLPFVGSSSEVIKLTNNNASRQQSMRAAFLPIPKHFVLTATDAKLIDKLINKYDFSFPLFLKPTKQLSSASNCIAYDQEEVKAFAFKILKRDSKNHIFVEELLPNSDVTCGYLRLGNKYLLLPTKNTPCLKTKNNLRSAYIYQIGENKYQYPIHNKAILDQLRFSLPNIIRIFGIKVLANVKSKVNNDGRLSFFDVDVLPKLGISQQLAKQCLCCFPTYTPKEVYTALLHTVMYQVLYRYSIAIPKSIENHHLFALKSDRVIKAEVEDYLPLGV